MKKLSILMAGLLLLGLCSCGTTAETQPEPSESAEAAAEQEEQVIYEDQYVKVVFQGIDALHFVEGMSVVNVTLTNLSEQEITVLPMDSFVNDTMVQFTSGAPATMLGGKTMNYAMSFSNQTAGITDYSEITKLGFSVSVNDADFHEVSRSEVLTVEAK